MMGSFWTVRTRAIASNVAAIPSSHDNFIVIEICIPVCDIFNACLVHSVVVVGHCQQTSLFFGEMKLGILSVAHDVLYKVSKLITRNVWGVQSVIVTNQHPILSTTVCYKIIKLRYNSDCICPSGAYYIAMARQ